MSSSRSSPHSEADVVNGNIDFIEKFKDRIGIINRNGKFSREDEESDYRPESPTGSQISDINQYVNRFVSPKKKEASSSSSLSPSSTLDEMNGLMKRFVSTQESSEVIPAKTPSNYSFKTLESNEDYEEISALAKQRQFTGGGSLGHIEGSRSRSYVRQQLERKKSESARMKGVEYVPSWSTSNESNDEEFEPVVSPLKKKKKKKKKEPEVVVKKKRPPRKYKVHYKPHTIDDYKNLQENYKQSKFGGLGPNPSDSALRKKQFDDKVKDYAQRTRLKNREMLKHQKKKPKRKAPKTKRQRAFEFDNKIRVRNKPESSPPQPRRRYEEEEEEMERRKGSGSSNRKLSEFEKLELQHKRDTDWIFEQFSEKRKKIRK